MKSRFRLLLHSGTSHLFPRRLAAVSARAVPIRGRVLGKRLEPFSPGRFASPRHTVVISGDGEDGDSESDGSQLEKRFSLWDRQVKIRSLSCVGLVLLILAILAVPALPRVYAVFPPTGVVDYIPITLTNNQAASFTTSTSVLLNIPWNNYAGYLDSDVDNVGIFDSSGNLLLAWCESNCINTGDFEQCLVLARQQFDHRW